MEDYTHYHGDFVELVWNPISDGFRWVGLESNFLYGSIELVWNPISEGIHLVGLESYFVHGSVEWYRTSYSWDSIELAWNPGC